MNTRTRSGIFLLMFTVLAGILLFACAPSDSQPLVITTASAILEPTANRTPTYTLTPAPSQTSTPTDILPLEKVLLTGYFDTATATFDVAQVVTVTPAVVQECPLPNDEIEFESALYFNFELEVDDQESYLMDFLNRGGTAESILNADHIIPSSNSVYFEDITGDKIPEVIATVNGLFPGKLLILECNSGEYQALYRLDLHGDLKVLDMMFEDLNLDGIPEVFIHFVATAGNSSWSGYKIIGWDGDKFINMISQTEFDDIKKYVSIRNNIISTTGYGGYYPLDGKLWEIKDVDQNGTLELVLTSGVEIALALKVNGPYQSITQTYTWNGKGFVLEDLRFGLTEYRYQAVQNGDIYTLMHRYERANDAYNSVINNSDLDWWSDERRSYYSAEVIASYYDDDIPSPTMPAPDENEYPNLAAYAQYRMILLDVLQGQLPAAEVRVQTMQEQYLEGEEGYIFVKLAQAFWGEYKVSQDIHLACARAVEFAGMHQDEVLKYIGGDHGYQSLDYEVADLCPFS